MVLGRRADESELGPGAMGVADLHLLDPARIDVEASRRAGEPRRAPAPLRAHYRPRAASAATLMVLHDRGAAGQPASAWDAAVLDIPWVEPPAAAEPSASVCASTDLDLAALRAAVLDLDAVLTAWPRTTGERLVLVASGVAATGALIALGAGLAESAGGGDPLRHELLLDLGEGDPLHERIVDAAVSRIAAAVLIDPVGAAGHWRDVALARVVTPVALIEGGEAALARGLFEAMTGCDRLHVRGRPESTAPDLVAALASRPGGELFPDVAARPEAFGWHQARHARGASPAECPAEICRSDFARDLLGTLWRAAARSRLRPGWS